MNLLEAPITRAQGWIVRSALLPSITTLLFPALHHLSDAFHYAFYKKRRCCLTASSRGIMAVVVGKGADGAAGYGQLLTVETWVM